MGMLYVLLAPTTRARPLLALCVSVERVPLATLRGGQSPDGIAPYALHAYQMPVSYIRIAQRLPGNGPNDK